MKKVTVLMSTYNGERYLEEQIQSIKNQKNVQIDILVRDDGSLDNTIKILKDNNIKYIIGKNLKPALSFMDLISKCNIDSDYYALSDQDDYWLDNKLDEAIKKIERMDTQKPILYFSSKEVTDKNLNKLYNLNETEKITIGSAMIKNIATGCTMVFNKKLFDILQKYNPQNIEMHDAWIYRLCLAVDGIIIHDNNSYILYRQHGSNVVGAKENNKQKIKRRLNSLKNPKHYREKMAQEILNGYADILNHNSKKIINYFANYRKSFKLKLKLLFDKSIRLNEMNETIIFKIAVLLNRV